MGANMRLVTLIGVNHSAGMLGPLPTHKVVRESNLDETVRTIFNMGYQNVLRIRLNEKDPFVYYSPGHGRIVDIA
jgi:hypothetical protein